MAGNGDNCRNHKMKIIHRKAIRALILTPERKILLMQAKDPDSDFRVWYTPGGGVKNNENPNQCLHRELKEETGLQNFKIGPAVWHRKHTFQWGTQILSQDEVFYLVPVDEFQPEMKNNPSKIELTSFCKFKWWTTQEIALSKDQFAPRLLSKYLEKLINSGPPQAPIDVGI